MSTPSDLPERPRRAPAGGGEPGTPASPSRLPTIGRDNSVDLDRLRASAAQAIAAEEAQQLAEEREAALAAEAAAGTERRTGSGRRSGDGAASGVPTWIKAAIAVSLIAAVAALGVALTSDGDDDVTTRDDSAAAAPETTAVVTTEPPPTTVADADPTTTPPPTDAPTTAPTTAAPVAADPNAPPPHKATYRGGKLYLEVRITSQEEAQKYIDKAAAVLGADNVVNNYAIDPAVPLSNDGTVYVDEPFLFETGSADLNPQYTGVLGLGVAALKLNPNARMVVTGYTDNTGDPARNQELSVARANAVVDYMVNVGGIERTRFDAIGAGDGNPVGDNNTEEGRKLNRRIDVKLVNLLG